jgi:hypothetical protein
MKDTKYQTRNNIKESISNKTFLTANKIDYLVWERIRVPVATQIYQRIANQIYLEVREQVYYETT